MLRLFPLAVLLALPLAAQAQMANYCGGAVVADRFETRVTQTPIMKAHYAVILENRRSTAVSVIITVRGGLLDRPSPAPIRINPNQRVTVQLGNQAIIGSPPMRGEQLANVTGVSCV